MTRVADHVRTTDRFARSANVERDDTVSAIKGYMPTARAIDVVGRVVSGLEGVGAARAISVTGPYGSGKSSLALFLSALFGPSGSAQLHAGRLLNEALPELGDRLDLTRASASQEGFVVCAVVAQREPVTTTLLRALRVGVSRYAGGTSSAERNPTFGAVLAADPSITATGLRELIERVASEAPLLMIIDEFGKNLEQFVATGGAEDDLFVLQEIAEWAASSQKHPIVLLTLQHLAFEDYAAGASAAKRREWSKVQGRFADIPYVESPAQSQALVASVFDTDLDLSAWTKSTTELVSDIGIADQIHVPIDRLYPLHPVTAVALPELCARYGQNERTLFSFLAGPDPRAVPSWIVEAGEVSDNTLLSVRLDRVYDYFLESASTMVSAASTASRWLEIETRIRDAVSLDDAQLRVLKSVAVLNLVTAGGALRASRQVVQAAAADGARGTNTFDDVEARLVELESRGLITYRAFADEYRIWSGTDFDLKAAVELARRRLMDSPVAELLERVRPQNPIVAARHSQQRGVLRVFERRFFDSAALPVLSPGQKFDGAVLLWLGDATAVRSINTDDYGDGYGKPILIGSTDSANHITRAGIELASLLDVLNGPEGRSADWVARQELTERASAAAAALDIALEDAFGPGAKGLTWRLVGDERPQERSKRTRTLTVELSTICDNMYPDGPIIRNEMLARRDLTSQGARARRELLTAMITSPGAPQCGLVGYGPERAMYEAILARPRIHTSRSIGYQFGAPFDDPHSDDDLNFGPTWSVIQACFAEAEERHVNLGEIYERLTAPPIGLKEGPIPVLVVAAILAHGGGVALYENGTFISRLDPPVIERLIRNPGLFAVKSHAISGVRAKIVSNLAEALRAKPLSRNATIIDVVGRLVGRARALPEHTHRTRQLDRTTISTRTALFEATEPDRLLFETLPTALGFKPIKAKGDLSDAVIFNYVEAIIGQLAILDGTFSSLLGHIEAEIFRHLQSGGTDPRSTIAMRVTQVSPRVIDTDVKAFAFALTDQMLERTEWLEYIGMVVNGKAPEAWTDDDRNRFDLRVNELSGAIRRVESLYYDQTSAAPEGSIAMRVSLTTTDGFDLPRVVWLESAAVPKLEAAANEALAKIEADFGSSGREMLLAVLAQQVLGNRQTDLSTTSDHDSRKTPR